MTLRMKTIRAVFENGVFKPIERVELPELTVVEFEPRPVAKTDEAARLNDIYTMFGRNFKAGGASPRKALE